MSSARLGYLYLAAAAQAAPLRDGALQGFGTAGEPVRGRHQVADAEALEAFARLCLQTREIDPAAALDGFLDRRLQDQGGTHTQVGYVGKIYDQRLHIGQARLLPRQRLGGPVAPGDFPPLPILGVPGWHVDNANPDYYANTQVFRPARKSS